MRIQRHLRGPRAVRDAQHEQSKADCLLKARIMTGSGGGERKPLQPAHQQKPGAIPTCSAVSDDTIPSDQHASLHCSAAGGECSGLRILWHGSTRDETNNVRRARCPSVRGKDDFAEPFRVHEHA